MIKITPHSWTLENGKHSWLILEPDQVDQTLTITNEVGEKITLDWSEVDALHQFLKQELWVAQTQTWGE